MTSSLITVAVEQERELPMPPLVMGVLIFALFCAIMLALLMFGKGRPHA